MFRSIIAATVAGALSVGSAFAQEVDVVLAVTDVEGLEQLQSEFGAVEAALEEVTGLSIELYPVGSRTAAVEALRSGAVNFVLTGPAEYVVMKELTDAEVVVAWQRPDYFAQVVVTAESEIDRASDLAGKTVAFGSLGSTSQHLGPAQALADVGLAYGEDYEAQIIPRNVAIEALLRGDIDAVGMNQDHLARAREAYPEAGFKVVARGPDLPNDILVAAADVDDAVVAAMKDAFVNHGARIMEAVLQGKDNQKYSGGVFLTAVTDANYDYVRDMYRTIGVDTFSAFVGD